MKIAVGISGGVDSSVAAWLLKQQGHDLVALFMINWRDTTGTLSGDCPWQDDIIFARLTARKLGIPLEVVDLTDDYRQRVVDYMFAEYRSGRTPNPDVLCNREIKFDVFAKAAFATGAQAVATGHYCRKETCIVDGKPVYRLLAGSDPSKDQSYFLCQLSQEQLATALFPVGDMLKSEVRHIAEEQGLVTARRKDSQGICFVGKVDLPVFLQQKLSAKEGLIIEIPNNVECFNKNIIQNDLPLREQLPALAEAYHYSESDGRVVGKHCGAHFYTIGQRKGLNVGGMKEPLFVIATDVERNIIYVGQSDRHPGLYHRALLVDADDIHWLRPDMAMRVGEERAVMARVRYRQPLQHATLYRQPEGMYVLFDEPQRGITPGQFAAWYEGDELTGSGVIH